VPDPKNGIAANLDQGSSGTCVRYAVAACLYEQIFAIMWKYCLVAVHLSQQAIADILIDKLGNGDGCQPKDYSGQKVTVRDHVGRQFSFRFTVTDQVISPGFLQKFSGTYKNTGHVFSYATDKAEDPSGQIHARHCVYLRKYDAASKQLAGHNSWGTEHSPEVKIDVTS